MVLESPSSTMSGSASVSISISLSCGMVRAACRNSIWSASRAYATGKCELQQSRICRGSTYVASGTNHESRLAWKTLAKTTTTTIRGAESESTQMLFITLREPLLGQEEYTTLNRSSRCPLRRPRRQALRVRRPGDHGASGNTPRS